MISVVLMYTSQTIDLLGYLLYVVELNALVDFALNLGNMYIANIDRLYMLYVVDSSNIFSDIICQIVCKMSDSAK